jgi:hypothetical protein
MRRQNRGLAWERRFWGEEVEPYYSPWDFQRGEDSDGGFCGLEKKGDFFKNLFDIAG